MKPTAITTTQEAQRGFYPTPPDLAEKLLAGIDWTMIETVLEPSAGKGDLVWAIARAHKIHGFRSYRDFRLDVDLVEIDPHLRSVLAYEWGEQREQEIKARLAELNEKRTYDPEQHKYRELPAADKQEEKELKAERETRRSISANVVHDDFLTFLSRKSYNLIIMNPPFADGDAHLLKALEIAERSGGEVRCILNAETILNPYTNRRKVLAQKLQELGAEVSYITGAFKGAERETDVTVAVIKAKVPSVEQKSYIYERLKKAAAYEETAEDVSSLALEDFLENIVSRFNLEVDAGLALIDEYNAMRPYLLEDAAEGVKYNYPIITLSIGGGIPPEPQQTPEQERLCPRSEKEILAGALYQRPVHGPDDQQHPGEIQRHGREDDRLRLHPVQHPADHHGDERGAEPGHPGHHRGPVRQDDGTALLVPGDVEEHPLLQRLGDE